MEIELLPYLTGLVALVGGAVGVLRWALSFHRDDALKVAETSELQVRQMQAVIDELVEALGRCEENQTEQREALVLASQLERELHGEIDDLRRRLRVAKGREHRG